jgi:hypothetical protein
MNHQDQLTLSLLTACVLQQGQMLQKQNGMLLELLDQQDQMLQKQNGMLLEFLDRFEPVEGQLWRMNRGITGSAINQAGMRKRATKKRHPAPHTAISRKRRGK